MGDAQRVAATTGILMASTTNPAEARQSLVRAGDRTHRSLLDVDTVLHTGGTWHLGRPVRSLSLPEPKCEVVFI